MLGFLEPVLHLSQLAVVVFRVNLILQLGSQITDLSLEFVALCHAGLKVLVRCIYSESLS